MSTLDVTTPEVFSSPLFLSEENLDLAKSAAETLAKLGANDPAFPLPPVVLEFVVDTLKMAADGRVITAIPPQTELTVKQAAEVICVFEPFMEKLLDTGKIPSQKVGDSRFVQLKDLLEYDKEVIRSRRETLKELAREGQEMGLYDD